MEYSCFIHVFIVFYSNGTEISYPHSKNKSAKIEHHVLY